MLNSTERSSQIRIEKCLGFAGFRGIQSIKEQKPDW